jgi:hypothetical protein
MNSHASDEALGGFFFAEEAILTESVSAQVPPARARPSPPKISVAR